MRCTIGLDQILRELFESGQYLYSTKARPTPEPSVLIASSVLGEPGWTVKTWLNTVDLTAKAKVFMYKFSCTPFTDLLA